jgi:ankyrin repeat protein
MEATHAGHIECARLLLEAGANKEAGSSVRNLAKQYLQSKYILAESA